MNARCTKVWSSFIVAEAMITELFEKKQTPPPPQMSDSFDAILVLSYFLFSDFPVLLVCDGEDFRKMHTTKIDLVADTSRLGPRFRLMLLDYNGWLNYYIVQLSDPKICTFMLLQYHTESCIADKIGIFRLRLNNISLFVTSFITHLTLKVLNF